MCKMLCRPASAWLDLWPPHRPIQTMPKRSAANSCPICWSCRAENRRRSSKMCRSSYRNWSTPMLSQMNFAIDWSVCWMPVRSRVWSVFWRKVCRYCDNRCTWKSWRSKASNHRRMPLHTAHFRRKSRPKLDPSCPPWPAYKVCTPCALVILKKKGNRFQLIHVLGGQLVQV